MSSTSVTDSELNIISSVNGVASLLILLLSINFIYNVYIKQRLSSSSVTFKINNKLHFKLISIAQLLILTLALISCIICTFFISNLIFSNNSSTLCKTIYVISYSCFFIVQYLCLLMFIFRIYNTSKIFSPKWKKITQSTAIITSIINIIIIILYFYISSPSLTTNQSSASNLQICAGLNLAINFFSVFTSINDNI